MSEGKVTTTENLYFTDGIRTPADTLRREWQRVTDEIATQQDMLEKYRAQVTRHENAIAVLQQALKAHESAVARLEDRPE